MSRPGRAPNLVNACSNLTFWALNLFYLGGRQQPGIFV